MKDFWLLKQTLNLSVPLFIGGINAGMYKTELWFYEDL